MYSSKIEKRNVDISNQKTSSLLLSGPFVAARTDFAVHWPNSNVWNPHLRADPYLFGEFRGPSSDELLITLIEV